MPDQQTPAPGFGVDLSLVGSIWLHPPRGGRKAQGFKEGSSLHRSNVPARWERALATVPVGGAVHFRDPVIQHGPG